MNFLNKDNGGFEFGPQIKALYGLLTIVAFICAVAYSSNHSARLKDRLEEFSKTEIKYVVTEKALDSSNRNSPYIVYNGNRHPEYEMMWQKIDVGDSLYKQINSYKMSIYKTDTVIVVDYNDLQRYYDSIYANE